MGRPGAMRNGTPRREANRITVSRRIPDYGEPTFWWCADRLSRDALVLCYEFAACLIENLNTTPDREAGHNARNEQIGPSLPGAEHAECSCQNCDVADCIVS